MGGDGDGPGAGSGLHRLPRHRMGVVIAVSVLVYESGDVFGTWVSYCLGCGAVVRHVSEAAANEAAAAHADACGVG